MNWKELAAAGWSLREADGIPVALSPDNRKAFAFRGAESWEYPAAKAWAWGSGVSEADFAAMVDDPKRSNVLARE